MTEAHRALVGVGSNLDAPEQHVRRALAALGGLPDTDVARTSSLYRTAAWGDTDQPDFCNAAAFIATGLAPLALLDALQGLERAAGRRRDGRRWGPRVLDLDMLLYDGLQQETARLTLPHAYMHERAFVLVPALEMDPDLRIPGRGRAADCLARLDRSGIVRLGGALEP